MGRRPAVTFVIMAGGRGERLWPLVRVGRPKVCLSADGRGSLLAATLQRLRPSWPAADWLVVTTQEQAAAVRAAVPAGLRDSVLAEPEGRNTAACLTLAAALVASHNPRRVLVVVPADHWVGDARAFARSVRAAITASAAEGAIATIGVRATEPHPGFGYLCAGAALPRRRNPGVFRLARFVEKPSRQAARRLLAGPRTYWISGIFIGAAQTLLDAVQAQLPAHARLASLIRGSASVAGPRIRAAYRALPAVSFDQGVMNRYRRGLIIEGAFPWADLGSWDSWERRGANASQVLALASRGVRAVSQQPHLIAAIGVHDLLVVHTPSATLICPPDRAQAVREIVKRLGQTPRLAAYR